MVKPVSFVGSTRCPSSILLPFLLTDHCILLITVLGFFYLWSIDMETSPHIPSHFPHPLFILISLSLLREGPWPATPQKWLILSSMEALVYSFHRHVCDILSNLMFELLMGFNRPVVLGTLKTSFSHQYLTNWLIN